MRPTTAPRCSSARSFTPLRNSVTSTRELGGSQDGPDDQVLTTELDAVGPVPAADKAETDYSGPGLYYVIVNLTESVFDLGAPVELPLELEVEVGGTPVGDPEAGIGFVGADEPPKDPPTRRGFRRGRRRGVRRRPP